MTGAHRSRILAVEAIIPDPQDRDPEPMTRQKLDDIDIRILEVLQADGRITNRELAEKIGLSPSPCHTRVKRLISSGIVAGFHASLDLRLLAPLTLFFVEITLREHTSAAFRAFEQAIAAEPEVVECHGTGGGFDYLAKIAVSDVAAYQAFIQRMLDADIGIGKYFSYVVTNTVKANGPLPLS